MIYLEIMERIKLLFPGTGDGMIKSLFNHYSESFQRETCYGILTQKTIDKDTIVNGRVSNVKAINLETVSSNNEVYRLINLDTDDLSGLKISDANVNGYYINNDTLFFVKSNGDRTLSFFNPGYDVVLSGQFIDGAQLVNDLTTPDTDFNNSIGLAVINGILSELYKLDISKLNIYQFYKNEYLQLVKQFRKYGMSAQRPAEVRSSWYAN